MARPRYRPGDGIDLLLLLVVAFVIAAWLYTIAPLVVVIGGAVAVAAGVRAAARWPRR